MTLQEALQGKRMRKGEPSAMDKLLIQDFFELKELDKPTEAWKDQRKLSKFLYGIHEVVNTLIRAC